MTRKGLCAGTKKVARRRNTTLEDEWWDYAREIGGGGHRDHAKGLRKALRAHKAQQPMIR